MEINTSPRFRQTRCCFLISWIAATVTGFIFSLSLFAIGERPDLGGWQGVLGGGAIGLFQGLVLMRYQLEGKRWMLANAIAWGIAGTSSIGVVGWFAPEHLTALSSRLVYGIIEGLKIGAIAGFLQWLAMKPKHARLSPLWIFLSALIWGISLALGWVVGGELRHITNLFLSEAIGLTIAWTIVGFLTGIALNLLCLLPSMAAND